MSDEKKTVSWVTKNHITASTASGFKYPDGIVAITAIELKAKNDRIAELETALDAIRKYAINNMTISSNITIATHGATIHEMAHNALDSLVSDAQEHGDGHDKGDIDE